MGHENVAWLDPSDREESHIKDVDPEVEKLRAEFSDLKGESIKDVVVKYDGTIVIQLDGGKKVRFRGLEINDFYAGRKGEREYDRVAEVEGGQSKKRAGVYGDPFIRDEHFLAEFVDAYANELETIATQPGGRFSADELEMVNKFRTTHKLPKANKDFHGILVRIAQDFRLTPDEIDVLIEKFLE